MNQYAWRTRTKDPGDYFRRGPVHILRDNNETLCGKKINDWWWVDGKTTGPICPKCEKLNQKEG